MSEPNTDRPKRIFRAILMTAGGIGGAVFAIWLDWIQSDEFLFVMIVIGVMVGKVFALGLEAMKGRPD